LKVGDDKAPFRGTCGQLKNWAHPVVAFSPLFREQAAEGGAPGFPFAADTGPSAYTDAIRGAKPMDLGVLSRGMGTSYET
jgi:hypothetical protein